MSTKVSLLTFFLIWAKRMRWEVPDVHVRACYWLEHRGKLAVLRCFRGFGKSTILAVYNAWRYYKDPTYRILHQSESNPTAYKTSRDTQNVIRNHPLTRHLLAAAACGTEQWWVYGSVDSRNASMYARGILSNVTSARADECQNDDVEVPGNIATPEAREKMRYRLGEQVHIMVPGASQLYIGTPHTHDSLYDEIESMGADCLTIRMFAQEHRITEAKINAYNVPFVPEVVFSGIGKHARVLELGKDYQLTKTGIAFFTPPGTLVDCYSGSAWPERFDMDELAQRRRKTKTINEWDSQYQLHSKPVTEVRLDPNRIIPYDVQPTMRYANGAAAMFLGSTQIVGAIAYWDCSLGKIKSDASAFSLLLTDARGQLYWHVAEGLEGEIAEFDEKDRIIGGQVHQVRELVIKYQIPRVIVETNGPGGFVPTILKQALKGTGCGVGEEHSTINKQKRILDAFESPLSARFLWAHVDVLNGPVWDQMQDFNPALTNQDDDFIDSGAGAIAQTPVRIGRIVGKPTEARRDDWRPDAGVHEVQVDY
ncbi:phage terminase large subunit [Pseudomonas gingeri]|uniref:phage terminase large subunit n=1 Tax=Pseudomonas gingeri TaxID=117681 RepID=UPI0015A2ABB3|nr:phage terminase large subunit [Pseudomonas gingeri]NWA03714.1 phage terminase large subunit [Pseudomonas gingeri]NWA14573.1 phage terminase large subunit [Pseudomonas gingeri]NWA54809.1 phage terminase large subunit [Pseudomonas gingeri]NWA94533.1 phage terminase large subunit [Pseudomonas gingeri]NWB01189.1 phage terminase large subunit [Pseudomonas gingeri]